MLSIFISLMFASQCNVETYKHGKVEICGDKITLISPAGKKYKVKKFIRTKHKNASYFLSSNDTIVRVKNNKIKEF